MRVTSVELHPEGSSDIINLSFRDPRSLNPYQVKSIAPLDADELVPQYYGTGVGGSKYHNITLKKREPVMLIGLNPRFGAPDNHSFSVLRDRLYRLVSSSRTGVVAIKFLDGDVVVATIAGTVSKVEASQFTEKPEVQLTFNCPDPMLKSEDRKQLIVTPFVDNDLTIIDEYSTAPSGFRFQATFNAVAPTLILSDDTEEWEFKVQPTGDGFFIGDVLHFSSEHRNKYLYVMRGTTKIQLADVIKAGAIWPVIFPGSNRVISNRPLTWSSIDHYLTYWGV